MLAKGDKDAGSVLSCHFSRRHPPPAPCPHHHRGSVSGSGGGPGPPRTGVPSAAGQLGAGWGRGLRGPSVQGTC